MKLLIAKVFVLVLMLKLNNNFTMAGTIAPSPSASQNLFAADILPVIVDKQTNENVIYSPASIQTCLTLAFMGAEGKTADEMRQVLRLGQENKLDVAQRYGEFLNSNFGNSAENKPELKMANGIYVNNKFELLPQFNKIANDFFQSKAESLDFGKSEEVAKYINSWVEEQTKNKITNLIQSDAINTDTTVILVNAIYFKAKWYNPFSTDRTSKKPFYMPNKQIKDIDMMYTGDYFNYVDLPELKAQAIELPYENSNISMLIILPYEVEGLQILENNLKGKELNEITSRMRDEHIAVYLPKFRIEFEIDLKEPLKKMGLENMFSDNANFGELLASNEPQKIAEVKHKAFLDVNEMGSEVAAGTYANVETKSSYIGEFNANHPFFFAIRSKTSIYFAGHVAKF